MNTTFAGTPVRVSATTAVRTQAEAISWSIWAGLVSAISIGAGIYWDISWHEAIGRDTFWTPAHLLIQFGAVLAGGAAAWVIFRTTFSRDPLLRGSSVNVLGFRGPLGAFVSAWGGVAMVTSAPFDNWWHNAYGLDVKIISPPHLLLALGIAGINWGAALMAIAEMNRAEGAHRRRLQWVLMILGGFIVLQSMTVKLEYSNRVLLHSAISYMVISIGLLLLIEAMARVSGHRWARTIMAGTYMLFVMMMAWILPLFPAHPKLGPIYQQITHMVPLSWPILLVVPAFVLDLAWPAFQESPKWQQAFFGGVAFLAILIAVEWPFATFLMSPGARNWFFATNNYPYFALPWSPNVQNVFLHAEHSAAQFWGRMGLAFVASIASMWIGIIFGNWLKRVRR